MNERDIIEAHFNGRLGRFLEIGSNDGKWDSLTYGLIQQGWRGVMVEPDYTAFSRLVENHCNNPNLTLVHAAVSDFTGLAPFFSEVGGGQVSTLDTRHRDAFIGTRNAQYLPRYFVGCVSPLTIMYAFGGYKDWDLIVIDAEGVSCKILKQLPLDLIVGTKVICVECDSSGPDPINSYLSEMYETEVIGVNVIGVRK